MVQYHSADSQTTIRGTSAPALWSRDTVRLLQILLMAILCCPSPLRAAQSDIEGSVPAGWTVASGALSISGNHYKLGSQSLRWDWNAGDTLTIANPGIAAADLLKGTCEFWVWNGTPLPGQALRVQFLSGSTPQYWFDMYCNFTGWRHAERCYVYDMAHIANPSSTITSVRIQAPASGNGSFYIDAINWTTPTANFKRVKDVQNIDIAGSYSDSYKYNCSLNVPDIGLPTSVSADDAKILDRIRSEWKYNNFTKWTPDSAAEIASAYATYSSMNIVSDGNGIRGMPMKLARYTHPDIRGLAAGGSESFMEGWTKVLAVDAVRGSSASATASRDAMVMITKHMMDQGIASDSNEVPGAWYSFESFSDALLLTASTNAYDPETKQKLWDFFRYNYCMGSFWDKNWASTVTASNSGSTDEIREGASRQLGAILFLAPTDAETIRWLMGYKRHMEQFLQVTQGLVDGIKADFTGFHHSMHYVGYLAAIPILADNSLVNLHDTPYQINAESYLNMRNYIISLLTMSTRAAGKNPGFYPNALTGRFPFNTALGAGYVLTQDQFQSLVTLDGQFYNPTTKTPQNSRIAQLYNQRYGVGDYPAASGAGLGASLDGFYQFNYSPLGIFRRGSWVASMRGITKDLAATEIWGDANCYGRYLSYGALEIMYHGAVSVHGEQLNGWDWNHNPGTTSIVLPEATLKTGKSQYVKSQRSFAGALAFHDGQSGLSACDFQESTFDPSHNPTFVWKKSWFCFDNQIICIGSNIANNDAVHPTNTTLFQLHLSTTATPMSVDGTAVTDFPYAANASTSSAHYLLDPFGTGYYIYPGVNIALNRSTQISAKQDGKGSTTTDNFATAWINHGAAPTSATYEYVVFPGSNDAEMATHALEYGSPTAKPYTVVQRDADAHVVKWLADGRIGYALYSANAMTAGTRAVGLLSNANSPCLVMSQSTSTTEAWMTVVDPCLAMKSYTETQSRDIDVTCNGHWMLDPVPATASVVSATASSTILRLTLQDGLPVHLHLVPEKIATSAIAGIGVPATGGVPTTTIADTEAYTASVSWSPSDTTYRETTVYTATITLNPKQGYTLAGVPANFFTVAGATTTNNAGSGIITAVFPATLAIPKPPVVAVPASVSPNPVTGTTAMVSVVGNDDGGEAALKYTWSTTGTPPAPVTFTPNGTNGAKNATASFSTAGTYALQVVITDAGGLTTSSTVNVTVNQALTSLTVTPATASVVVGQTQAFSATGRDQFGLPMTVTPTWTMAGGGSINANGLYTAATAGGPFTVTCTANGRVGSAAVTVTAVPNLAPQVTTAATAMPGTVSGTSAALTVLASDDGGEPALTYTWSTTGTPPAPVTFTPNSTHDSHAANALFSSHGIYDVLVTITDAGGQSATSAVTVTVEQSVATCSLSPALTTVTVGGSQTFSLVGVDQFGHSMKLLPTWSISGGGTIGADGIFTATKAGGPFEVTASIGGRTSSAMVTVLPSTIITNASSPAAAPSGGTGSGGGGCGIGSFSMGLLILALFAIDVSRRKESNNAAR